MTPQQGGSAGLERIAALCRRDPWQLRADLHAHSDHSDGTLTPEALAARACAEGVELLRSPTTTRLVASGSHAKRRTLPAWPG